jgi:hypothetical protein
MAVKLSRDLNAPVDTPIRILISHRMLKNRSSSEALPAIKRQPCKLQKVTFMHLFFHRNFRTVVLARLLPLYNSYTQPIKAQPIHTPMLPHHTQLVKLLLARRRPPTYIPFLRAQHLAEALRRAV